MKGSGHDAYEGESSAHSKVAKPSFELTKKCAIGFSVRLGGP